MRERVRNSATARDPPSRRSTTRRGGSWITATCDQNELACCTGVHRLWKDETVPKVPVPNSRHPPTGSSLSLWQESIHLLGHCRISASSGRIGDSTGEMTARQHL